MRELWEESGVVTFPKYLQEVAEVDFHNEMENKDIFLCRVHYFFCYKWFGIPESRPKEYMINPTWFLKSHMPYERLMPADEDYITLLFKRENSGWILKAKAFMGSNQTKVLKPTEISWVLRSD